MPLPRLADVADRLPRGRVLVIVSPDSKIPPEEVQRFFEGLSQKNNLCVLTGDKTTMGSVEKAARQLYAAKKANDRIPEGHPQRGELESKQAVYEQDFNVTVLGLFDKVLFPIQRPGRDPQLAHKPLDMTRDATTQFDGEEQIEKTLVSHPIKLYSDVEKDFDAIRDKAEDLLWPENQDDTRWADAADRYAEQPAMIWLPPKALDVLKTTACNRGLWEDLGNGYITKQPKKKRTSAQIVPEPELGDEGRVRLRVNAQHAGPAPRIHYAEDSNVSESSPVLKDNAFSTTALRVAFLICDPSGQHETGEPVVWTNQLMLRSNLTDDAGKRRVELFLVPRGEILYTLDGSEPRDGAPYTGPITIGDDEVLLRAFATADDLEAKRDFRFQPAGKKGVHLDPAKPARLVSRSVHKLDSRDATFEGLKQAQDKTVHFENVTLTVGQGARFVTIMIGEVRVEAAFLTQLLKNACDKFPPDAPITMAFQKAHFASGHDLEQFCQEVGLKITQGSVDQ